MLTFWLEDDHSSNAWVELMIKFYAFNLVKNVSVNKWLFNINIVCFNVG